MSQLNLFSDCYPPIEKDDDNIEWKLFVDGASRKNPGQAGAGIYLLKNDVSILKRGFFLGIKTNNQAEYLALLIGIYYYKKMIHSHTILFIMADSELLVRQVQGKYKVRDSKLQKLYALIKELLQDIKYSICHVARSQNKEADKLANVGINEKTHLPHELLGFLQLYDISI